MKILIVGGGGREHALAWKAAQAATVEAVYVAPGNAGTAREAKVENVAVAADDIAGLLALAKARKVGLTIVGPEAALVAGIVDRFSQAGLRCFGPTRDAARLEGSKSFCKDFLRRHKIPTAAWQSFSELAPARAYIRRQGTPIVVKADGLAAGKGVVVAQEEDTAIAAVEAMLGSKRFGEAGRQVVIEEFLNGEEASFIVMSDGRNVLPLASCQDHKARDEGDQGPNTGGMGAYSPAPVVSRAVHARIMETIIRPTIRGMQAEGNAYVGFLYAGVMISSSGSARLLEYNCRLGDPEAQALLLRLKSDLVSLCSRAVDGRLAGADAEWDERAALGVVLAAAGYPAATGARQIISGLDMSLDTDLARDIKVFHAGTACQDEQIVTTGGRVLCVSALGENVTRARRRAYAAITNITWPGMFYRKDIAWRAVAREAAKEAN